MTNKQIMSAQKVLRRLEGTPVRIYGEGGKQYWQVTYDNDTYRELLNVVTAVASIPVKDVYTQPIRSTEFESITDYHRDKI